MTGKQRILVAILCGAVVTGGAAWADRSASETVPKADASERMTQVASLIGAAQLDRMMDVVSTEGTRHGLGLEGALFPGQGGESWAERVAAIQAPERLLGLLERVIAEEMAETTVSEALAFYDSALGARVALREVDAREAMLDAEIEAGAIAASTTLSDTGTTRAGLVAEMIDALDLVAANVSSGLNANFAFYRGLDDGGAMRRSMTEGELLAMVWSQEDEVRQATEGWLQAYLMLAYTPLSDDELRSYVDWVTSPPGRKMNAALFAGFGRVFEETSYELGRAAARFIGMTDT